MKPGEVDSAGTAVDDAAALDEGGAVSVKEAVGPPLFADVDATGFVEVASAFNVSAVEFCAGPCRTTRPFEKGELAATEPIPTSNDENHQIQRISPKGQQSSKRPLDYSNECTHWNLKENGFWCASEVSENGICCARNFSSTLCHY